MHGDRFNLRVFNFVTQRITAILTTRENALVMCMSMEENGQNKLQKSELVHNGIHFFASLPH